MMYKVMCKNNITFFLQNVASIKYFESSGFYHFLDAKKLIVAAFPSSEVYSIIQDASPLR